jgi:hypothetical protein
MKSPVDCHRTVTSRGVERRNSNFWVLCRSFDVLLCLAGAYHRDTVGCFHDEHGETQTPPLASPRTLLCTIHACTRNVISGYPPSNRMHICSDGAGCVLNSKRMPPQPLHGEIDGYPRYLLSCVPSKFP